MWTRGGKSSQHFGEKAAAFVREIGIVMFLCHSLNTTDVGDEACACP